MRPIQPHMVIVKMMRPAIIRPRLAMRSATASVLKKTNSDHVIGLDRRVVSRVCLVDDR